MIIIILILFIWIFISKQSEKYKIYYKNNVNNKLIHKLLINTLNKYNPIFINGHIHTIFCNLIKQKYIFETKPFNNNIVDWYNKIPNKETNKPIIIICHGLTGNTNDVMDLCKNLYDNNFECVVFNKRGHHHNDNNTLQEFGDSSDISLFIDYLSRTYTNSKLFGIGVSAGSGLLYSYIGDTKNNLLTGCIFISPGYNAYKLFTGSIPKLYENIMLINLKKLFIKNIDKYDNKIDFEKILLAETISEFDKEIFIKDKYQSIEEYWKYNNPMRNIKTVNIPILCINANDDPICKDIDYISFFKNENSILINTYTGGHCGFLSFCKEKNKIRNFSNILCIEYINIILKLNCN